MPNFVKTSRQMKKFSIQALDSVHSVCMAAICYSDPISTVLKNQQLLQKKNMCAKFQNDISKTEGLVGVYTGRQMDMAELVQLVMLFIYIHICTCIFYRVSDVSFQVLQTRRLEGQEDQIRVESRSHLKLDFMYRKYPKTYHKTACFLLALSNGKIQDVSALIS